jgi:hypothetical protein
VDYSKANAARKGTKEKQGSYMLQFGELIKRIQQHQESHHLFFLAENAVLDNDGNVPHEEGNLEQAKNAFGMVWSIVLDAMYFSPVCRKRTFLSNIPLLTKETDYDDETRPPLHCLQDGYQHAAHIKNPDLIVKANCFMASKSRVDDGRMIVVKKEDNQICKQRTMNTQEREDMMGYPQCYVEQPSMSFVCVD